VKYQCLILTALLLSAAGVAYHLGDIRGLNVGYALAYSEQYARVSEHERVMKFVGVCKWAKIMADDTRCGKELP
jgi:hypothetical protein